MQSDKLFSEGQQLHQRNLLNEAYDKYTRALKITPKNSLIRIFKALIDHQLGRVQLAVEEAKKALSDMKQPNVVVLVNYGIILKNANQLDDAAIAYKQALEINPKLHSARSNLATIYLAQGRFDQAESEFLELAPEMEDAAPWLNLARLVLNKNQIKKAEEYISKAEDNDPSHPDLALLKARMYIADADYKSAYQQCIKGLKKAVANRELWLALQTVDSEHYDLREIENILVALAKNKTESSAVLTIAVDLCRKYWLWRPLKELESMLNDALLTSIDKVPTTGDVFTLLGSDITQKAHLAAANKCWSFIKQIFDYKGEGIELNNNKKLRVAFISSDLRGHAIGFLVVGLFEKLPKENIEWYAYTNTPPEESEVRNRLRDNFDRFINVAKLDEKELADKIKSDKIDVLIDLNQITAGTRAIVFALRPAAVQIQWLGMPGTLGAGDDADYIIVDPWTVNEENADGFSECLMMLPRSYQPNDHVKPNLSLSLDRISAGLPEEGVIFGVFNQYYKFSPDTFELWARILNAVPNAFLWLLEPKTEQHKFEILQRASSQGIEKDRLIFAPLLSQEEHIARLQWMDLVLDTWPYNAHTTCSDALRAGVPVLTLPQRTFASRVATGILQTAGFEEWVATSPDEYVAKAIGFGLKTRTQINEIKADVSTRYWASPMVNNQELGRTLESMLLQLHARAKKGLSPTSLKLTDDHKLLPLSFGRQADAISLRGMNEKEDAVLNKPINLSIETEDQDNYKNDKSVDLLPDWALSLNRGSRKSRIANLAILKKYVLQMSEIPTVIDIGAAGFNEEIGYESLVEAELCRVIGFEPDESSYLKLQQSKNKVYLPDAVADGNRHDFNVCMAPGMNSLLQPKMEWLSLFPKFQYWSTVLKTTAIETKKLDDLKELVNARFIKIDVQGAEMMILKNSKRLLNELVLLEIEASPSPLYHGESSFFEVGHWLEGQGYVLHALSDVVKRQFKPYGSDDAPFAAKNQIFQVDAVFMPNPLSWADLSAERLEALAFLSHSIYKSFDVAMLAMQELDKRDNGARVENYRVYLDEASLDA